MYTTYLPKGKTHEVNMLKYDIYKVKHVKKITQKIKISR